MKYSSCQISSVVFLIYRKIYGYHVSPEYSLTPIVLDDLILDVYFMTISLADG